MYNIKEIETEIENPLNIAEKIIRNEVRSVNNRLSAKNNYNKDMLRSILKLYMKLEKFL